MKIIRKFARSSLIWFRATRAPFFTASIASVLLGTGVAWYQTGIFHVKIFGLAMIGAIIAHAGTNMLNDYFDHLSGNDEVNKYYNQFSGGSRIIQDGIFSPKKVLVSSFIAFLIVIVIGLYLNSILKGNTLLWIGLIGVILGITYSTIPFGLSYSGFGEIAVPLGFGVIVTLGSFFVQTQQLSWLPVISSVPTAILVGLILIINEFQDSEADGIAGKKTVVVRIKNKRKAILI
ncbi:MAG: prenyltransferase, partial [Candidatus Marinimicrobia bacterium]|nr:prenyltransferase [Candidatus Neomarinimicrobiota bacterium]